MWIKGDRYKNDIHVQDVNRRLQRKHLPYGQGVREDGTITLFNRDYEAIWQKDPAGKVTQPPMTDSSDWGKKTFFYTDLNPPWARGGGGLRTFREVWTILMDWGVYTPKR